jgi:hypothetical protein
MSNLRLLRKEEAALISAMIGNLPHPNTILSSLRTRFVEDMNDDGMGGVRFASLDNQVRRAGKMLAEAEFTDEDGVLVSAVVNLDSHGDLFELDIWKVDFSPLKRYPEPGEVRPKPMAAAGQ